MFRAAYRVLGEHWCEAVIDGSALQPGRVYFEKGQAASASRAIRAKSCMLSRAMNSPPP